MLPKNDYTSNKRFDFGIPLQDIFPPNDIHHRLKYLFEKAHQLYISNKCSLQEILRCYKGFLEECFKLKETITFDMYYFRSISYRAGAYFWLLRHFLGLLPIPLLPNYTNGTYFDWKYLADRCGRCLRDQNRAVCNILDYDIAVNLNFLPFEHFLLVSYMMVFIRKVCQRSEKNCRLDRESVRLVANYYCGSIFTRPYKPGEKEETMCPLFLYLIVRWRKIQMHCNHMGHPACFLGINFMDNSSTEGNISRSRADQWVQTEGILPCFQTEIVEDCRNIPHFVPSVSIKVEKPLMRSSGCQTELSLEDKAIQSSDSPEYLETIDIKENNAVGTPVVSSTFAPAGSSSFMTPEPAKSLYAEMTFLTAADYSDIHNDDLDTSIKLHVSDVENRSEHNINTNVEQDTGLSSPSKNTDLSFFSTVESSSPNTWEGVMKETTRTIKKVEEYIYDDCDTFKNEDYNQIGSKRCPRKSKSLVDKCSKDGWTYTPPDTKRETTEVNPDLPAPPTDEDPDETNGYFENSYHRFSVHDPDRDVKSKKNRRKMQVVYDFPKSKKSDEDLEKKDSRRRINFNLKKFKLNLDFFRVITPRPPRHKYSTKVFAEDSDVKYKKIKNIRSSTL